MRSTYFVVCIFLSMLYVTKWTEGSDHCDQENQDLLECFSCANSAATSKHCSNDTNELYGNWINKNFEKSTSLQKKNDTRCFAITKGSKIITRGLYTKEACDEKNEANTHVANVISKLIELFKDDDSITYKCCSWSCCNYNATTLALASAPTDADGKYALNITSEGLNWPGSSGALISCKIQVFVHLLMSTMLLIY